MKNLNLQMTLFVTGIIAFAIIIAVAIYNANTVGISIFI